MPQTIDQAQVTEWIDDELVESVEPVPDEAAHFNLTVEMSGMLVHVIQRRPGGPLLLGQEIEYGEGIRSRIQNMTAADRNELVARVRETLTTIPVVYGFVDERGTNVAFEDLQRIFLEYRIYPDAVSQHELMTGLVAVWKGMRYLDDLVTLIDSIEG
ncbi:DUF2299 family protein [Natribaculum luteum]|uniref:DUF2299 family protein n=1 Tax=Natribaculum luteum TaxID=1586232 RepID=A0ABD5NZ04_9EURY|nr:DUF2299 family protein [Natribaculum luteum]